MPGDVDPRNRLNDLPNREWLKASKSFWTTGHGEVDGLPLPAWDEYVEWLRERYGDEAVEGLLEQATRSFVLSKAPPRSKKKALHPATFSERDVGRLICLFSKPGGHVLDPFVGSGSTLIACAEHGREGVGIELSEEWAEVARERLASEAKKGADAQYVRQGDARVELPKLEAASFDMLLTSPPYWSVLRKKPGLKAKAERVDRGLPTHYSEAADDLGNIEDYPAFLDSLGGIFELAVPALRPGAYVCVIVSDFRHGKQFVMHHADVSAVLEGAGLPLKAITILAQDSKNLYPFGIPYHFISNIHHQYILIHQKPADPAK